MAGIVQAPDPENETPQASSSQPAQPDAFRTDLETTFRNIYTYAWDQDSDFQSGLSSIRGHTCQASSDGLIGHDLDLLLQAQCFYFARYGISIEKMAVRVSLTMSRKYDLPAPIDVTSYKSWRNAQAWDHTSSKPENNNPYEQSDRSPYNYASSEITVSPPLPQANGASPPDTSAPPPPSTPPSTLSAISLSSPLAQPSDQAHHQSPPPPPYPTSFASIVDLITRNQPIPGIEEIPNTVLDAGSSPPNKTPWRRKPWEKEPQQQDLETGSGEKRNGVEGKANKDEGSASNSWMQAIERSSGTTATRSSANQETAMNHERVESEGQPEMYTNARPGG
jgi:Family of unknown function (DUF5572)